jgi:hypothetical protein
MGYGRGAWYTPQWVDLFADRWVFGHRTPFPPSSDQLLAEHQHVGVGDIICDGPNYASYFRVPHVDPPHAVVYRSIRHPRRGSPIDINDPESPSKIEKQLQDSGTYVDFTWALVLHELTRDKTRLLVRTRANYSPPTFSLLSVPLGLFDATYGVAMLRAIARRAETINPRRLSPREALRHTWQRAYGPTKSRNPPPTPDSWLHDLLSVSSRRESPPC